MSLLSEDLFAQQLGSSWGTSPVLSVPFRTNSLTGMAISAFTSSSAGIHMLSGRGEGQEEVGGQGRWIRGLAICFHLHDKSQINGNRNVFKR